MKKVVVFFTMWLFCLISIRAKQIDAVLAKQIGQNFITTKVIQAKSSNINNLNLVYTAQVKTEEESINYFYVFNLNDNGGFIIVSADDKVIPILGYSYEKGFDPLHLPVNVAKWLEGYKKEIRYAIVNNIPTTLQIQQSWNTLKKAESKVANKKESSVNPLLQTQWDQSPNYNALCPYDNSKNDRTVTGCVATAMAQVMKYWNYPATGKGFHSYNHSKYGTLSANFATTTYNWSGMPNQVASANSAVATLMYQVGVSVDMNYDVASNGGSGAYVVSSASPVTNCAEYALENYFGYKNTLQGVERKNYTEAQWINLLKTELNASRPIIYAGFGSGGGHCFVNDGYDNSDFFHFNWGWSGSYDGYFSVNALNPGGVGTGGGTGGFNSGHQAIIGIESPTGGGGGGGGTAQTYSLVVSVDVTPSSSTVNYGTAFSVSTNIVNRGATSFTGKYAAAIFDKNDVFVDFIDSIAETSGLTSNHTYTNDLVFNSSGNFAFLPGSYNVYVFYKPTNGSWTQLHSDSYSIDDYTTITIENSSDIEMYADITVSPSTFIQNQTASVNLNLINNGSSTFYGQYEVNLYTLDGEFAETIGSVDETDGLQYNYVYNSPFLNFSSAKITSPPGTYLLAVSYKENLTSSWYLVGSSNYQNPIKINISEPPPAADNYENNNTIGQAYILPLNFTNNVASKVTTASNCHTGNDYDYYKIALPSGYNYSVDAKLQDLYNVTNGQTYSLDALFSYSKGGLTWSEAFDDVMPSSIQVSGSSNLYFLASPYFTGETGTYQLDLTITRTAITGINAIDNSNLINVYPNPANEQVTIDLTEHAFGIPQIKLLDLQGKIIQSISELGNNKNIVNLTGVSEGLYFLQITSDNFVVNKKLIVSK